MVETMRRSTSGPTVGRATETVPQKRCRVRRAPAASMRTTPSTRTLRPRQGVSAGSSGGAAGRQTKRERQLQAAPHRSVSVHTLLKCVSSGSVRSAPMRLRRQRGAQRARAGAGPTCERRQKGSLRCVVCLARAAPPLRACASSRCTRSCGRAAGAARPRAGPPRARCAPPAEAAAGGQRCLRNAHAARGADTALRGAARPDARAHHDVPAVLARVRQRDGGLRAEALELRGHAGCVQFRACTAPLLRNAAQRARNAHRTRPPRARPAAERRCAQANAGCACELACERRTWYALYALDRPSRRNVAASQSNSAHRSKPRMAAAAVAHVKRTAGKQQATPRRYSFELVCAHARAHSSSAAPRRARRRRSAAVRVMARRRARRR